ncbi:MAG TPA: GAF domain-containing protein [Euzebyales bacterium]
MDDLDAPEGPFAHLLLDDLRAGLLRHTNEIVGVRDGLWRLIRAVVRLSSAELDLAAVLQRIVEVAHEMVDAQYAALGVIGEDRSLQQFVHVGMDASTVERIGHLPEGHGVLGLLIEEPQVLRLDDLAAHPAAVGFPVHHPPMDSFLGVPIVMGDVVYGNLYLTNRRDGDGFTTDDAELVDTLAAVAAAAIDKARQHETSLRRQRWLEATSELTAELLGGAPTSRVHALIARRARELTEAATATLVLRDGDELQVVAAAGRAADALDNERFAVAGSLPEQAMSSGSAVVIDDISALDQHVLPVTAVGGYGPVIIVPLCVSGEAFATLVVARDKDTAPFSADERAALEMLADQVALALDYDRAQSQRRRAAVFTDRDRIGHDLHDLVIGRLFGAGLDLNAVAAQVADPALAERIDAAIDQVDAAIADLRAAVFALHGRRRDAASLTDQLDRVCREAETVLGFFPELHVDSRADGRVTDEVVPDLLAVTREALTNVARHANASHATVRLRVTETMVHLEIADDGAGITDRARRSGLANLSARASRLGGALRVEDAVGGGTRLRWHALLT